MVLSLVFCVYLPLNHDMIRHLEGRADHVVAANGWERATSVPCPQRAHFPWLLAKKKKKTISNKIFYLYRLIMFLVLYRLSDMHFQLHQK